MSFQVDAVRTLNANPVGRLAYNSARSIAHFARNIAHPPHPDDPSTLQLAKVMCREKPLTIIHRLTKADACVIDQCFNDNQYDMPGGVHGIFVDRIYQKIIDSDRKPLIVDCGANIGASVLWLAHRYPHSHVVAIEPAPDNFALLERNCAGLDVDTRQAGISATDGVAHLANPEAASHAYRTTEDGKGPEITLLSIHTLLASKPSNLYEPFLLKVDIEGAENNLFSGDPSSLNRFPLIIMEPHDWLLPGQHTSVEFFRFHAAAGREFTMKQENIASVAFDPSLLTPEELTQYKQ
jgi:FkbM family methyltransferase